MEPRDTAARHVKVRKHMQSKTRVTTVTTFDLFVRYTVILLFTFTVTWLYYCVLLTLLFVPTASVFLEYGPPAQERAVEPTRWQIKYSSNTQCSLPPETVLLKRTKNDINNSDEKECPATNHTGEQFSLYSTKIGTSFSLLREWDVTKSCHWFRYVSHFAKWQVGLRWLCIVLTRHLMFPDTHRITSFQTHS